MNSERRRDVFFFDTIQPCACQASFLPDLYKAIISLIKKRANKNSISHSEKVVNLKADRLFWTAP